MPQLTKRSFHRMTKTRIDISSPVATDRHRRLLLSKSTWAMTVAIILVGASEISFGGQNSPTKPGSEPNLRCLESVELEGKLVDRTFYGPSGPGKQAYERAFLLNLTVPVTVEPMEGAAGENGTCSKTFRHVRQVQLFLDSSKNSEAEKILGKVVVARGLLDEAHLPSQHTDVIMDVEILSEK